MPDPTLKDHIWSFGRETEVLYVNGFTKRDDYRQLCYDVVDAVIEIREIGEIRPEHVEAFAKATACPLEFVFCCGGKRLIETAHFSALPAAMLKMLATHPKLGPRFNVMCLMRYNPPASLGLELLALGLVDRSAKVACRAAAACDELGGTEALALLESRLPNESRAKVREKIVFTIELMRTPPVRNGRYDERTVHGVVFSRDVGPGKKPSHPSR
ncbi:MAG TPA: hypothetical protein VE988_15710 [Gemmataceae bacterium]|nr:hypothetical protein [Gemmataceae bacterium]